MKKLLKLDLFLSQFMLIIVLFSCVIASGSTADLQESTSTNSEENSNSQLVLPSLGSPHDKLMQISTEVLKQVLDSMKELVIDPKPLDENRIKFDLNQEMTVAVDSAVKDQIVQQLIHSILNYGLSLSPSLLASISQIGNNPSMTPAAKVIAIYNAIKSFETLIKSETDKEKAYAAADIGTTYLIVTAPPVGAAAALALMSAKITDQTLTNLNSIELAKIQIELNKLNQSIIKHNNKLLRAEIIPVAFELTLLNQLFQSEFRQANVMKQACDSMNIQGTIWDFEDCYTASIQFFYLKSLSSEVSIRLSRYSINDSNALKILNNIYKYEPVKLKKLGEQSRDQLNEFILTFSKEYQQIQSEAIKLFHQTKSSNKRSDLLNVCSLKIRNLLTEVYLFRQKNYLLKQLKRQKFNSEHSYSERIELEYLLLEFDLISSDYCFEFKDESTENPIEISQLDLNKMIDLKNKLITQITQLKNEYLK